MPFHLRAAGRIDPPGREGCTVRTVSSRHPTVSPLLIRVGRVGCTVRTVSNRHPTVSPLLTRCVDPSGRTISTFRRVDPSGHTVLTFRCMDPSGHTISTFRRVDPSGRTVSARRPALPSLFRNIVGRPASPFPIIFRVRRQPGCTPVGVVVILTFVSNIIQLRRGTAG